MTFVLHKLQRSNNKSFGKRNYALSAKTDVDNLMLTANPHSNGKQEIKLDYMLRTLKRSADIIQNGADSPEIKPGSLYSSRLNEAQKSSLEEHLENALSAIDEFPVSDALTNTLKRTILEKAVTQNPRDFYKSLDELYALCSKIQYKEEIEIPEQRNRKGEVISSSKTITQSINGLDLIRSFKLINDICFNSEVKFADFGIRRTINHYFDRLGQNHCRMFSIRILVNISSNGKSKKKAGLIPEMEYKKIDDPDDEKIDSSREAQKNTLWRKELSAPKDEDSLDEEELAGIESILAKNIPGVTRESLESLPIDYQKKSV